MLILGGIGLGLVWGWLLGYLRPSRVHRLRTLSIALTATFLAGIPAVVLGGATAAISFVVAAAAAALIHFIVLQRLASAHASQ